MFLEILIALFLGIFSGILTGLTPGLHINLVNVILLSLAIPTSTTNLITFIISMSITHTFIDSIPSIYLGAPDSDHILSALPGHKLLIEGKGHQAILATVIGGLGCSILLILLTPIILLAIKFTSPLIEPFIAYLLITILVYFILQEKKKINCLALFLISGSLGMIVLHLPNLNQPLFPLLSGLFGISILITSLEGKTSIPKQKSQSNTNIHFKTIGIASLVGFFAGFLPGLGSAQASILGTQFTKNEPLTFLTLTGGINTASMIISVTTAYVLEKARNGSIISILKLTEINTSIFILLLIVMLISVPIAAMITIKLSKVCTQILPLLPYKTLTITIIILLIITTILFDQWIGLIILTTSTALGVLTVKLGIAKHYLMGCLLLPVILFLV